MIGKILIGMLAGWILSWFGFDDLVIKMFSQFGFDISIGTYYVLYGILGLLTVRPSKKE